MSNQDIVFLTFYGLSTLAVSGSGLYFLITAKKNETEKIQNGWMFFIVGFTPGVMLITGFLLIGLIGTVFIDGVPNLISKMKRDE